MKISQLIETIINIIKNIFLGVNIMALTMIKNPKNMLVYIYESLFIYKSLNSKRGLPQKNVFEVLPADNIVNIKLGNLQRGETWLHSISSYATDIINLCVICQLIKPRAIFEIGTLRGYTAFHFALNSPDDAQIYTLDMPIGHNINPKLKTTIMDDMHIAAHRQYINYDFHDTSVAHKITCLFGDSATFDFSPFHGAVDLFFIDGAHSYEYVKSDTQNALKCCKPGSVIVWHDFGRTGVNGVSSWLGELAKDHQIYSTPGGSLAFMVVK